MRQGGHCREEKKKREKSTEERRGEEEGSWEEKRPISCIFSQRKGDQRGGHSIKGERMNTMVNLIMWQ